MPIAFSGAEYPNDRNGADNEFGEDNGVLLWRESIFLSERTPFSISKTKF